MLPNSNAAQQSAIDANALAIADLDTRVGDVEAVNVSQQTQISSNATAISTLDSRVDATETTNASQQVQIASNTTAIAGNTTAISGLGTRVSRVETLNTAQQAAITNLQTGLANETNARIAADTAINSRIDALESLAFDFSEGLERLDDKIAGSTAIAVAMSGNSFLPGKSFNLSGNVATYDGAFAGSLQIGAIVAENAAVNAGVATNFNKRGSTAARVGFTFGW